MRKYRRSASNLGSPPLVPAPNLRLERLESCRRLKSWRRLNRWSSWSSRWSVGVHTLMPALKARSPIVAMETSPLSEAQTARLLATECHRLKSEDSSAHSELKILDEILKAEGRVIAASEGVNPDGRSDFLKVPYVRRRYLNGKALEMSGKMCDLSREMMQGEPLPQLSVLGTMTEPERRAITFRLQAQDFKDGTVFMKQGWHGNAPVLTRTGCACRPPACRTYRGRRAACPWAPCMVRVRPTRVASGVPCVPRTAWHHRRRPLYHRARGCELRAAARPPGAKSARPCCSLGAPQPVPQRPSAPASQCSTRQGCIAARSLVGPRAPPSPEQPGADRCTQPPRMATSLVALGLPESAPPGAAASLAPRGGVECSDPRAGAHLAYSPTGSVQTSPCSRVATC